MTACVVVDDLTVRLSDDDVALSPTSCEVEAGAAMSVEGPNGAGKTTLLRVLAGWQKPTEGTAHVMGRPVNERDPQFRRHVAALIGPPPFARALTVREHLMMVSTSWGACVREAAKAADQMLDDFGLGALHRRFPHELSSGQTQLFSLATVLSRPFDVLLLDEPEQRLDDERLGLVIETINDRVADGACVIFASHNQRLIEHCADLRLEVQPSL
jgi:ABC-2 type transport system ATP-binding protein